MDCLDSKGLKISLSLAQRYRKIHTKKNLIRFFFQKNFVLVWNNTKSEQAWRDERFINY